jgi:hypothetical protein
MPTKRLRTSKLQRKKTSKQSEPQSKSELRRLFVDPASISTGWAYYVGKELKSHGTIATDKKWAVFTRLHDIWRQYRSLVVSGSIDEVHIEQLPRRCHFFTHWSVGAIGHALFPSVASHKILGDIPVKAWQKASNWESRKANWKNVACKSEDELAAICMGEYFVEKHGA